MMMKQNGRVGIACLVMLGAIGSATLVATATQEEPKRKRRVEKQKPGEPSERQNPPGDDRGIEKRRPQAEPEREGPSRRRPDAGPGDRGPDGRRRGKRYIPTKRVYGHVRVTEYPRRPDGRINVRRVIARSQRVTPVVLERFEDRRRDQLREVIRYYRERDRTRAVEVWARFVGGLSDVSVAVDLDEIMLYIAREGSRQDSGDLAYYGRRLDFLEDWQNMLLDYLDDIHRQRDDCMNPHYRCSERTIQNIERDLVRARSDLDVARTEEHLARDQFDIRLQSAGDYEQQFTAIYEEIYRAVEVRISISG